MLKLSANDVRRFEHYSYPEKFFPTILGRDLETLAPAPQVQVLGDFCLHLLSPNLLIPAKTFLELYNPISYQFCPIGHIQSEYRDYDCFRNHTHLSSSNLLPRNHNQ